MAKVSTELDITFQPYAECLADPKCDWWRPVGSQTRANAKYHTEVTGHKTRVVVERVTLYERRDSGKATGQQAQGDAEAGK